MKTVTHVIRPTPASLLAWTLVVAILGTAQGALSEDPPVSLVNLQPIEMEVAPGDPYDPSAAEFVYVEPMAYPHNDELGHRANIDLEVQNTSLSDYLRLDWLDAQLGGIAVTLDGHELLALPPELQIVDPALTKGDRRRPMLTNGGFGVTGLKLETHIVEDNPWPYGRGLDMLSLRVDSSKSYLVGGMSEEMVGDAPASKDDAVPGSVERGFLATYSAAGIIIASALTWHDEVSALAHLGDGRVIAAGKFAGTFSSDDPAWLYVARARVVGELPSGDIGPLAEIEIDTKYGEQGQSGATLPPGTFVRFSDAGVDCAVIRAASVTTANFDQHVAVAASLRCGDSMRAGIVVLDDDGLPLESFGNEGDGTVVLAGPKGEDLVPVGIAAPSPISSHAWLGAGVGDDCSNALTDCAFGVVSVSLSSGKLHESGWHVPQLPSAVIAAVPYDMTLDPTRRPVLAGTVRMQFGSRRIGVHKFDQFGGSVAGFGSAGVAGWVVTQFNDHDGEARGVAADNNGHIMLSVESEEIVDDVMTSSLGMMQLSLSGGTDWAHSPYGNEDDYFTHDDQTQRLEQGHIYERDLTSLPSSGLVVDWAGRPVLVGTVFSGATVDPCKSSAIGLGLPSNYFTCGNKDHLALARYLPGVGEPDSRRWIEPSGTRRILLPFDTDLGENAPSFMNATLGFKDYFSFLVTSPVKVYENVVAEPQTGNFGSYLFPFAPGQANAGRRFLVKAHTLGHHHRSGSGSRFAYDIFLARHDGAQWRTESEGAPAEDLANKDHLIWQAGVRAVESGHVVSCRRSVQDHVPEGYTGGDANYVLIEHTDDPDDESRSERISYVHLARESIPLAVCPRVCPDDDAGCDVDVDGVDPDGTLDAPVFVNAGDLIGRVGNTGNSGEPHLHIDLDTRVGGKAGSYPLLFNRVLLQSPDFGPDGLVFVVNSDGRAIAHRSLVRPYE